VAGVLFVCTGNICRSPTAEAVFRALVAHQRLSDRIATDSAGTHDYQLGEAPDPRAVAAARRRGYPIGARVARQIVAEDFRRFDWIIAMDRHNLRALEPLRPARYEGHVGLLLDFAPEQAQREVPDPYYGGREDFERVIDLVERATKPLLAAVAERLGAAR
jgi:protein-tyrosine phosphatase